MPGSAWHDVRDRVHAVHRGRDEPDLGVLADDRRVQAVERARDRRLGVERDLEALLAELPRRIECSSPISQFTRTVITGSPSTCPPT